jgi:chromatin segregation and condensation protein Rec8/ScpA/Scc1 (kleisin family)
MEVVVTFLAMLELVKVRAIRIFQEEATGSIQIEAAAGLENAPAVLAMQEPEEDQHGT